MRRARGALLPPARGRRPRRADLYRLLRSALLEGALRAGERLPSSRLAAADYGVSRGLLEEVFDQLTDEGFLTRAVGRGTFVSSRPLPPLGRAPAAPSLPARPSRRGTWLAEHAACREPGRLRPFNAGTADAGEFPWRIWERLQARVARELGPEVMGFADPRGAPDLRGAIARHLAQSRGIRCRADQVVVFNSSQQAIHALALLLLAPGDEAWLEDPGYPGARAALALAQAAVVPVPVDNEGLRVQDGARRAPAARLIYVTPPHQYPTGVALSLPRRLELLDWARRRRAWVVEDDYDGELRDAGEPLTPLHSLDPAGRVLHVSTLSKPTFLSLRLAFAVVPEALVEPLANVRTHLDGFTAALPQLVMSRFMDEGYFPAHLRRVRRLYAAKRSALVEGLAPLAAQGWAWPDNAAGLHLALSHSNARRVRAVASRSGLELALVSAYRLRPAAGDGLFLRFGGLDAGAIQSGLRALVPAALRAG